MKYDWEARGAGSGQGYGTMLGCYTAGLSRHVAVAGHACRQVPSFKPQAASSADLNSSRRHEPMAKRFFWRVWMWMQWRPARLISQPRRNL